MKSAWQIFPWRKKQQLPRLSDLSPDQRAKLPTGQVTHLEWVEKQAFGESYWALEAWLLGARQPIHWTGGKWV